MLVVPGISNRYQSLVKTSLVSAALVSTHQQVGLSLGVKGKGHTPDLAAPVKPEFLHVGVLRSLQAVDRWLSQIGPKLRKQFGVRQKLVLQVLRQRCQLVIEVGVKDDIPAHGESMIFVKYGFKSIFWRESAEDP